MTVVTNNTIQPSSGQALTIKDEGGTASLTVQTDGDLTLAENVYLGSGKGIYFDGQTTSANFLDDYEEGTWTPTITAQSGSPTTVTVTDAVYTKIGRLVTVSLFVSIGNKGTADAAMRITLPITASSENFSGSGAERTTAGYMCTVFGENTSGKMNVRKYDFTTVWTNNHEMKLQCTYRTS